MKTENKKPARYFNDPVDESEVSKLKLKKPSQRVFTGDVIEVAMTERPLEWKLRQKMKYKQKRPKIDKELLAKHSRGEKASEEGVKTKFFKEKLRKKEVVLEYATEQAARTEILLNERQGFIEADEEETTTQYRQREIAENVDITSASKHFKLNLDFGPYHHRYTKNGRHLLIGGKRGHIAAFDWITKKLHCEINVMEEIADVSWMHIETMFACAQKKWVYFYDNQGTELHCVKKLYNVNKLEFLPYHFLLSAASSEGFVSWLDVSMGELVGHFNTKMGDIRIMRQNPTNGVMCIGGGKGVVSMWSPKVREPLAKMLCHSTPLTALAVDPKGNHLVTAGLDCSVKVWDIRMLEGPLAVYKTRRAANKVEVSQRGVLALSMNDVVEMYQSTVYEEKPKAYLRQRCENFVHELRFCPYEDILGISTAKGFQSFLVPGSGEPNFDALEANPYMTKTQRREHEVHALLEKVPAEFIALDPNKITEVDVGRLQDKVDAKKSLFYLKPPQIEFKSRRKMKGRGGTVKAAKNKQIVKDLARKEFIQEIRVQKKAVIAEHKVQPQKGEDFIPLESSKSKPSVLDRFRPKKLKK